MDLIKAFLCILLVVVTVTSNVAVQCMHRSPISNIGEIIGRYNLEPLLWRSTWILNREFTSDKYELSSTTLNRFNSTNASVKRKDKLFVKLKPDKSVVVCNGNYKDMPLFEICNKRSPSFKSMLASIGLGRVSISGRISGGWKWEDDSPAPTNTLTIETIEGSDGRRVNHRITFMFTDEGGGRKGVLFRPRGAISVYKGGKLPVGAYRVGGFSMIDLRRGGGGRSA